MPFGSLSIGEMILIFAVLLLLFGPKRLPELASGVGKGIRDFKRSLNGLDERPDASLPGAYPAAVPGLAAPAAAVAAAPTVAAAPAAAPAEASVPGETAPAESREPTPAQPDAPAV